MPTQFSRLRRWIAISVVLLALFVAGVYLYARHRIQNALKDVPGKINVEVQQSANGFSISRSEQGRTVFKIQANKAVQFRAGGRVELHDVTITLFGRDSSRFDQIYGSDFVYDPQSGEVTSKGEVQIDLEANPQGLTKPDQAAPKELKNPLHLRTSGLVFNQKTGNASTQDKVEFSLPQAQGSSIGVNYDAEHSLLVLQSQVQVDYSGAAPLHLTARHGSITKEPRTVVLESAALAGNAWKSQADRAILFLTRDNAIDHLAATGHVVTTSNAQPSSQATAEEMIAHFAEDGKSLATIAFNGNVKAKVEGKQPLEAAAQRVLMNFAGRNVLSSIHSRGDVRLVQHQAPASGAAQDLEIAAAAIDYRMSDGRWLKEASTQGPGQITIRQPANGAQTVISADKFVALFNSQGQLASLHGAPHAKIVAQTPGEKERVSTSENVDATFQPGKGIESLVQQGNFEYSDGEQRAWSGNARYVPDQRLLTLSQSPRVALGASVTTANGMRLYRDTGEGVAEGDVKSTYNDMKPEPQGSLLASGSPIHVTAQSMKATRMPTIAVYSGNARLWQDAKVVQAPVIRFDRDHRSVVAEGSKRQPVSTVLVQLDKAGRAVPVTVTSDRLTYTDSERRAHFEGNVVTKGAGVATSAAAMDVFLEPAGSDQRTIAQSNTGKIDHIVASGSVVVSQPGRRAAGDRLVYTASEDKFVMTGGPPSIFDAEHGKITGVSLTFFRGDDRVVIEGSQALPTVTQTRVAR